MTARQAATIAQTAQAKLLVLTHFSQRYNTIDEFVREAYPIHPNVIAVQDGDVVTIPKKSVARLINAAAVGSGTDAAAHSVATVLISVGDRARVHKAASS